MTKAAPACDPAAARLADRLNLLPILVFGLWLGPMPMLWLQLFGPLRPFAFAPPSSPAGPWFLAALILGVAGLFAPGIYFQPRAFETRGRFYRWLGVEAFRAWSTNGDRINRYVRARHPGYTVHRGALDKALANCLVGERTHLAFGLFGLVTSVYTFAIGWNGWAVWMTITNIVGNFYPLLLQRHTRARILRARDKGVRRADSAA